PDSEPAHPSPYTLSLHDALPILDADATVVGTGHALSLRHALSQQPQKTPGQKRYQNQGKNTVSSIIGSYKSAVTKNCNRLGLELDRKSTRLNSSHVKISYAVFSL